MTIVIKNFYLALVAYANDSSEASLDANSSADETVWSLAYFTDDSRADLALFEPKVLYAIGVKSMFSFNHLKFCVP